VIAPPSLPAVPELELLVLVVKEDPPLEEVLVPVMPAEVDPEPVDPTVLPDDAVPAVIDEAGVLELVEEGDDPLRVPFEPVADDPALETPHPSPAAQINPAPPTRCQ
jgi:hypothetical protein